MDQEKLFNEWKNTCIELQSFSGFFQNDFKKMLEDGLTTKEEIVLSYREFLALYCETSSKLNDLKSGFGIIVKEILE